jgi:hypothetical protein
VLGRGASPRAVRAASCYSWLSKYATIHCAADEEDEDEEGGGSAVVQKKKSIGPTGPLVASTVNKDKKKDDMQFSFESARSAVLTRTHPATVCACGVSSAPEYACTVCAAGRIGMHNAPARAARADVDTLSQATKKCFSYH